MVQMTTTTDYTTYCTRKLTYTCSMYTSQQYSYLCTSIVDLESRQSGNYKKILTESVELLNGHEHV